MLSIIWFYMIVIASVFAVVNGKVDIMVANIAINAQTGFNVALNLIGPMAFWLGVVKIAEQSGLVDLLVYSLRPLVRRAFPEIPQDHPAMGSMLLSISSNMLGLNNAATPMAIRAMQALQKLNTNPLQASNAMCLFMCVNASSVQILPVTAITLLSNYGNASPMRIVITSLIATSVSTLVSVIACLSMQRRKWFQG